MLEESPVIVTGKNSVTWSPASWPLRSAWMLVAGVFFAAMGACVKAASPDFSNAELVFYRSVVGLLVIGAMIRLRRQSVATRYLKLHLYRGISGGVALALYFYAITHLPLATAVTLNYTSPLFLGLLMTFVFKEKPHAPFVVALLLGFAGVVILLHPTINQSQWLAGAMGLGSGFLAGVAFVNVKAMGKLGEPDWRVVFYFSLLLTVASAVWMLFSEVHAVNLRSGLILFGIGAFATFAQLALTRAHRTGKTMVVGSFAYSTIVFSSIIALVLFDEALPLMSWIAIGIIIVSGIIATRAAPAK
ncbi:MAG: DMT family transporter [Burkholderiales bacterium]